eukprot:scaffold9676_cov200-Amphora_coffeaeformis.AAC.4
MPCFENLPCETYHTPSRRMKEDITIYGGHLYYTSFMRTFFNDHSGIPAEVAVLQPPEPNFTCFTTFREPVSRIQSCWNYRMIQESLNKASKLSDLTPEQTVTSLSSGMSRFGEGFNFLHEQPLAVVDNAMNQTIKRVSQCIVGVLERCEDTKKALEKHLPWFAPYFICEERLNTGKVKKEGLNSNQTKVIEELAVSEIEMYKIANKLLDIQMQG